MLSQILMVLLWLESFCKAHPLSYTTPPPLKVGNHHPPSLLCMNYLDSADAIWKSLYMNTCLKTLHKTTDVVHCSKFTGGFLFCATMFTDIYRVLHEWDDTKVFIENDLFNKLLLRWLIFFGQKICSSFVMRMFVDRINIDF